MKATLLKPFAKYVHRSIKTWSRTAIADQEAIMAGLISFMAVVHHKQFHLSLHRVCQLTRWNEFSRHFHLTVYAFSHIDTLGQLPLLWFDSFND